MLNEAVEAAVEQKDACALSFILAQCEPSDGQLIAKINTFTTSWKNQ